MNIILLGPPGSGKGTQAQHLKDRYGLMHLSTGEMLRREISLGTPMGLQIKDAIESGQIASDDVVAVMIQMIEKLLDKPEYSVGVILDGFPRTTAQARALDDMLKARSMIIDHVIELKINEELLVKRIVGRFSCAECGACYNDFFRPPHNPGTCDVCGGHEFKRRADDTEDTVKKRLEVYHTETMPIIPYYLGKGILHEIDGMRSIEEVATDIDRIIERR